MQNKNLKIITGANLRFSGSVGYSSFQIGCVIVEYCLFNTTTLIRNPINIRFGIILTQFYINFSRQEHQIDVLYVTFKTWDSQVSAYTPFHLSFTAPSRQTKKIINSISSWMICPTWKVNFQSKWSSSYETVFYALFVLYSFLTNSEAIKNSDFAKITWNTCFISNIAIKVKAIILILLLLWFPELF